MWFPTLCRDSYDLRVLLSLCHNSERDESLGAVSRLRIVVAQAEGGRSIGSLQSMDHASVGRCSVPCLDARRIGMYGSRLPPVPRSKTELDVLRENHRFIRDEAEAPDAGWEAKVREDTVCAA